MKKIIKYRFVILALWLVSTVLLTAFQPDINAILRNRGQQSLSENSPSVVADSILSKMETSKGTNDIIVFYNENKISDNEMQEIEVGIDSIIESKADLGINDFIDPFNMPEAKPSLISEDGTTLMISFKLDKGSREISDIKEQLDSKLSKVSTEHYFSGEDFINNDYLNASQSGVEKSAALTVIFILVVLVIVFKSVVTPLISLIAVAFSYLCSMGIASQLIDKAGFPLTSLTQMLLILILFGIGTDYNILLFNRFKEELSKNNSVDDSIINTYKTAGKTIIFSIITVLIAFFSLIFAESPIYRSGVVVVIGVATLLLEILTLTPFIMKSLGNKLFWPSKKVEGHKENKFWGMTSKFATKKPILTFFVIVTIIVLMMFGYKQKLNFDTIKELGNSYSSSKAFNIVADHFGRGKAMPTTVLIESDKTLDNSDSLAVIENLTEKIKSIDGVSQVSSLTQPQGEKIDNFYISTNNSNVKTFFIPNQVLQSEAFKQVYAMFMSSDKNVTKLTVILDYDPYSNDALNTIEEINKTVSNELKGTVLSNANYGTSGPSATTKDMNDILSRDLSKATIIVIIGVLIILILIMRSFWIPVCITGSLVGAYYAAMCMINFIFIKILGIEGISSFVPFFSFIIIVALGVDYSIFLMMRFKEYSNLPPKEAIVLASKHIGGVIISAVIILGGTFATLMPSGIILLSELAVAVITGLIILCLILLPTFIPATISLLELIKGRFNKKS